MAEKTEAAGTTTLENEVVAATITVSASAAAKLLEIMDEKGVRATHALRVFVSGGGCSGLQYGMTFDGNPRDDDHHFEEHGLRVVIDPQSILYMDGSNIDFVDTPSGGGFQIDNPNAASSCGGSGCQGCH